MAASPGQHGAHTAPAEPQWLKQGQRLARRMEEDILNGRHGAGTFLGTEPELIQRYGVSRTVLREAIRLLEHDGIASMRRGPGGGLRVVAPDTEAVTHAAAIHLRFLEAPADDLYAMRALMEPRAAAWAAERVGAEAARRLEAAVAEEHRVTADADFATYNQLVLHFHELVAELSANPVCLLFTKVLTQLTAASSAAPRYTQAELAASVRAHDLIAQAIIAGDPVMASHRMLTHMRASQAFAETLQSAARC